MIPHLRTARLVAVFGDDADTVIEQLRVDAESGGVHAIIVMDTPPIEGHRFATMLAKLAHEMDGLVLLYLGVADPRYVKDVLGVADLGVAASKGSDRFYIIPKKGKGRALPVLREGVAA